MQRASQPVGAGRSPIQHFVEELVAARAAKASSRQARNAGYSRLMEDGESLG